MLTYNVTRPSIFDRLFRRKPRIIALYAYRHDAHLVPDMLANIQPFIDGWIAWNDTKRDTLWYHEGEIRQTLINAAREYDADWVLCVDPDERFEVGTKEKIRELVTADRKIIWGFKLREMYTVNQYRTDGLWGHKKSWRLFSLNENQEFMNVNVHSPWHPINPEYKMELSDINLYHLKMIAPENRKARAELYNVVDTTGVQAIGYDYLADETGMTLEKVPQDRFYYPYSKTAPHIFQATADNFTSKNGNKVGEVCPSISMEWS